MKTKMKNPIIKEILLGKTVEEVIEEHFSDYEFEGYSTEEKLPEIIREIIRIGKSDLRFAVCLQHASCDIIFLNGKSDLQLENYWESDGDWAKTDEASQDCDNLNDIVERLYGVERKRPKAKITKEAFLKKKGKVCPFCLSTKITALDEFTWTNHDEMGCRACGETWDRDCKTVVTGFSW